MILFRTNEARSPSMLNDSHKNKKTLDDKKRHNEFRLARR